jgi:PAS domain S-box-containing protein
MKFSESENVYFDPLAQTNNRLNLLINRDLEILESNLNTSTDVCIKGKKVGILWDDMVSPLGTSLLEKIDTVFKSGKATNLPIQQATIPIYNLLCNYWQINLYPFSYKGKIETILLQLEDISPLMNIEFDPYQGNYSQAESSTAQITGLKQENFNLKIKEEKLRILVENIKDYAIFLLDNHGYITTWNSGAEQIKQYKSSEIIGQHFSIFYTEEAKQRNHPQEELKLALKNGRYEEEGWRVKKDGSLFWANVIITPIFDDEGLLVGFGKVTRDLSERKKIENLKNEFISVVSHELRTPLTSVRGSLSLILESDLTTFSEKNIHLLRIANNNCDRLARLVDDVLDIEKLQEGHLVFHFNELNLKPLIQEAVRLNELFSAKYNVQVVSYAIKDAYVYADEDRLMQVLTNLLSNAVKFSSEGSLVEVTMGKNTKYVSIFVRNRGEGIPAKYKQQVFERFFQVDSTSARKKEGSGLGLAISKEIVERHKGAINYYSIINKKTTFYFRIPLLSLNNT